MPKKNMRYILLLLCDIHYMFVQMTYACTWHMSVYMTCLFVLCNKQFGLVVSADIFQKQELPMITTSLSHQD